MRLYHFWRVHANGSITSWQAVKLFQQQTRIPARPHGMLPKENTYPKKDKQTKVSNVKLLRRKWIGWECDKMRSPTFINVLPFPLHRLLPVMFRNTIPIPFWIRIRLRFRFPVTTIYFNCISTTCYILFLNDFILFLSPSSLSARLQPESKGQSEHMTIIITVFGLILGGMVITFLVNCVRKIMHDQKIIRVSYHFISSVDIHPRVYVCLSVWLSSVRTFPYTLCRCMLSGICICICQPIRISIPTTHTHA